MGLRTVSDRVELVYLRLNVFFMLDYSERTSMVMNWPLLEGILSLLSIGVLLVLQVLFKIFQSLADLPRLLHLLLIVVSVKLLTQISPIIRQVMRCVVCVDGFKQTLLGTGLLIVNSLRISLRQAPARILLSLS